MLRSIARREDLDLARCRYLEIGGNHPISCSATYLMSRVLGMRGVIVEANPHLVPALKEIRDQDQIVHAAVTPQKAESTIIYLSKKDELSSLDRSFVSDWPGGDTEVVEEVHVRALTINEVLEANFSDQDPVFLSIDIEGVDFEVLRSLDWARWRPAIITAEPSEHHISGNTLAISNLLRDSGYVIIAETDVNLIALDASRAGIDASDHIKRCYDAHRAAQASAVQREAAAEIMRHEAERLIAETRALARQLEADAEMTQHEAERLRIENERLGLELNVARQELKNATRSISAYLTSTSWKVTAPLRMLARFMKPRG